MSVHAEAPFDVDTPVRAAGAVPHLAIVRTAATTLGTVQASPPAGGNVRARSARRAIRVRALPVLDAPLVSMWSPLPPATRVFAGALTASPVVRRRPVMGESPTTAPASTGATVPGRPTSRRGGAASYTEVEERLVTPIAVRLGHARAIGPALRSKHAVARARAVEIGGDHAVGDVALGHPAAPGARLTRRGHLTLVAGAASVGAAIIAGSWCTQHAAPPAAPRDGSVSVVVSNGDSLWSIAARVAPARDPRAEISDLLHLNRLTSPDLIPGQVLRTR